MTNTETVEVVPGALILEIVVPSIVLPGQGYSLSILTYYQEEDLSENPAPNVDLMIEVEGGTAVNATGTTNENGEFITIIQHDEPADVVTVKVTASGRDDTLATRYGETIVVRPPPMDDSYFGTTQEFDPESANPEPLLLTIKEINDETFLYYWLNTTDEGLPYSGYLFEVTINGGHVTGRSDTRISYENGLIVGREISQQYLYCSDGTTYSHRIDATLSGDSISGTYFEYCEGEDTPDYDIFEATRIQKK